jgi:hypothetical protein
MNPFEISNHEKQKEKHAAIQFFRSLLASCAGLIEATLVGAIDRNSSLNLLWYSYDGNGHRRAIVVRANVGQSDEYPR